jgi:hypothetical protein
MFVLTFPIYIRRRSQYSLIPVAHQLCVLNPAQKQDTVFVLPTSPQSSKPSSFSACILCSCSGQSVPISCTCSIHFWRQFPISWITLLSTIHFSWGIVSLPTLMFLGIPLLPPQQVIPLLFPESSAPIRVRSILNKPLKSGHFNIKFRFYSDLLLAFLIQMALQSCQLSGN